MKQKVSKTMNKLIVISSPSGCGKDTVLRYLLKSFPHSRKIITSTTRTPRNYEIQGKHYHFIDKKTFLSKIERDEFIEWQDVFGELYGISKEEIAIQSKYSFIILDVLGALRLKKIMEGKPFLIFLNPPSRESLKERLEKRNSDSAEEIEKRLERYDMEVEMSNAFDAVVINDELEETISKITTLIECHK